MIICTEETLAVGEHCYGPTRDANLDIHEVAFVVLRETDEAEYRAFAAANSTVENPPFLQPMRFYEVAMD